MGSSQSKDEEAEDVRAVSVERSADEEGATKIIFTDDFVKYIRAKGQAEGEEGGEGEPQPAEEEEPAIEAESVMAPLRGGYGRREGRSSGRGPSEDDSVWKQRYEMEKAKNEKLKSVAAEQFEQTVGEVRDKIASQVPQMVPVCEDFREKVSDCYLANPGRPLNCHSEVSAYMECVTKARRGELDSAKQQTSG